MTVLLAGFESGPAEPIVAVLLIEVPAARLALTRTKSVNTCGPALAVSVVRAAVMTPVLPTGGVVTAQPAGAVSETKVVFADSESFNCSVTASLGPAFVTVSVYVRLAPADTGSGLSALVIDRSVATGMTDST